MEGFEIFRAEGVQGGFEVLGDDAAQLLTVNLVQGETLTCEPGSMAFSSTTVKPGVDCGHCSQRACLGGNNACVLATYTAETAEGGVVSSTMTPSVETFPLELVAKGVTASLT
mmetsp:Transcript_27335/g.61117  ORF Transcript_27335/g.61117 Transcript_27335/m.61117 type:complete len:113 (+) Transcript_27335:155-493(+)